MPIDRALSLALKKLRLPPPGKYYLTVTRLTESRKWAFVVTYLPESPGGHAAAFVHDSGKVNAMGGI
jgi:hypothetical protein